MYDLPKSLVSAILTEHDQSVRQNIYTRHFKGCSYAPINLLYHFLQKAEQGQKKTGRGRSEPGRGTARAEPWQNKQRRNSHLNQMHYPDNFYCEISLLF